MCRRDGDGRVQELSRPSAGARPSLPDLLRPRFALRPLLLLADFRPDLRADLRADDRRADFRALFFADRFADFLLDFLLDFLADFLRLDFRPADFLAEDFLAPPFLAAFFRGRDVRERDAGSSPPSNEDEDEELGLEEGVLSIGNGSIHPEPDQPISI